MSEVIVKPCTCTADKSGNTAGAKHQDALLGKGNRYHNKGPKGDSGARCTVCGTKR